jgi:hypothetical protein
MAFLIYKKSASGAGIRYERLEPLKLGGRDGLIAGHVKSLPVGETGSWNLTAAAILKGAGFGSDNGELTILFDATGRDATSVCLYELIRIHGSCRDSSTQLALDFAILVDQNIHGNGAEYSRQFEILTGYKPKALGETIALSGGPSGGDWKWTESAMNLGVTVVPAMGVS